jgi:myosin-5
LPNNFSAETLDGSPEWAPSVNKRKDRDMGFKRCNFGVKKTEKDRNVESPYIASEEFQSRPKIAKSDWDDNVGYFIKKVILGT